MLVLVLRSVAPCPWDSKELPGCCGRAGRRLPLTTDDCVLSQPATATPPPCPSPPSLGPRRSWQAGNAGLASRAPNALEAGTSSGMRACGAGGSLHPCGVTVSLDAFGIALCLSLWRRATCAHSRKGGSQILHSLLSGRDILLDERTVCTTAARAGFVRLMRRGRPRCGSQIRRPTMKY